MGLRFVREREVRLMAGGISHSTLWRWEREGKFPKRRRLGKNSVGWLQDEIEDWINNRAEVNCSGKLVSGGSN